MLSHIWCRLGVIRFPEHSFHQVLLRIFPQTRDVFSRKVEKGIGKKHGRDFLFLLTLQLDSRERVHERGEQ